MNRNIPIPPAASLGQRAAVQIAEECCYLAWNGMNHYPSIRRYEAARIIDELAPQFAATAKDAWLPIETAPKDGTWVLLAGPSGYSTDPLRVEVCSYRPKYRPLNPWQNHGMCAFTDGGTEPTHWQPLPPPPASVSEPAAASWMKSKKGRDDFGEAGWDRGFPGR